MNESSSLPLIGALGPNGPYVGRQRTEITDVTGRPALSLSLAPLPYVSRAMSALRKGVVPPREERLAAVARAGEAFRSGTVDGLTAEDYIQLVSRVSGLGISEVRSAVGKIAAGAADAWGRAQHARPGGVVEHMDDERVRTGAGVWVRRGDVFGAHAAGNHPAIHGGWLEAIALGYRVAVRPSRREPLTPHRLVLALWEAGIPQDVAILLPTDYAGADELLRQSDVAMAYGGQEVMEKYRDLDLLPQGPGRSKMLLTSDVELDDALDLLVDSAVRGGGTGCTNVTGILVEGDAARARAVAEAVAARLAEVPSLPPEDPAAVLPVHTVEGAQAIERFLVASAGSSEPFLGGDGIVDELGDGSAALRPSVRLLGSAGDVQSTAVELAFPCVWVAPWSASDGIEPLRSTLNLVIMGERPELTEAALVERSIRNVYVGMLPSYFSAPGMPHDDYLSGFLMRAKGFVHHA